jgi:hypothetical protein
MPLRRKEHIRVRTGLEDVWIFGYTSLVNVDEILGALAGEGVDYLLIGGMNFLLRHRPELTFDVDVWVSDTAVNLENLNRALQHLGSAWGPTERDWQPVPDDWHWLRRQPVYCLTTEHGALDVFREVCGLENRYEECKERSLLTQTAGGVPFRALSDQDMLACQEALPPAQRKQSRIDVLREAIRRTQRG